MVSNSYIITKIYLWMDLHIIADDHILADISKSTYEDPLTQSGCFCQVRGLLDTRQLLRLYFLVFGQQGREGRISIRYPDQGATDGLFELLRFIYDNDGRARCIEEFFIFRISQKGQLT